jgi:hypothetical protein
MKTQRTTPQSITAARCGFIVGMADGDAIDCYII